MRISRRSLIAALAVMPALATHAGARSTEPAMPPSLTEAARRTGRYFGTAARIEQIQADGRLRQVLLSDCTSITPEIHMKWDALQPAPDRWRTGPADDLVAFARDHGLAVRGHTLLWDQSTPEWARRRMLETGDWSVVADYFSAVLGRYRNGVVEWDVVNEPIDPGARSDGLRTNTFLRAYGPGYIERALRHARADAPDARLMINDYSFDYDNPVEDQRRHAFLRLLERLKRDGVPLDGVGLQAHLDLGKGPLKAEILRPFLAEIAGMGLDIAVTELDVKEQDRSLPLAERDRRVADEVRRYLDIVLQEPAVKGVTTWGLTDPHSWLQDPATGPDLNRGLPLDAALAPKPMHEAIRLSLSA